MPIPNFTFRPDVSQIPKELAEKFPAEYSNLVKNESHIYANLPLKKDLLPEQIGLVECVEDWHEKFSTMASSMTSYLDADRSDTMRDLSMCLSGYKNYTSAAALDGNALIEACKYENLFDLGGLQDTISSWTSPTSMMSAGLSSINSTIAGLDPAAYNVHEAAVFKNVQSQMTNEILNHAFEKIKVKEFDLFEYLDLTRVLRLV